MWTGVTKDIMRMVWTCLHVDAIRTLCEESGTGYLKLPFRCKLQVAECHVCQKTAGRKISKAAPALHCVPVVLPWHHVGIDFIGPISPPSTQGSHYILTMADYFTKFVEAIPTPTKHADGVALNLFKVKLIK